MASTLVFTFVGADKPGLVQKLAQTVGLHGGNWLQSRMSELAGQFAGIVQVEVDDARSVQLRAALQGLSGEDLSVVVASSSGRSGSDPYRQLVLKVVGHDRPGIVREVTSALASRQINVSHMDTSVSSAPMSGDPLFEAVARIQVARSLDLTELSAQLDTIADTLTLEIDLEESDLPG